MRYQPALRPDQIGALYHLKVAVRQPLARLVRAAVDCHVQEMKRKEERARRAGTTLPDWLAYEEEREREASAAAKLNADPLDANAPF
jgi:hypothetical protein